MRMNYVYGQPSLLVKQCVMNSWANNTNKANIDLHEYIKNEQKKLKGCWIENFYFGHNDNELILERLIKSDNITYKSVDLVVKKIIMSCYITYNTVKTKLNYLINEPEVNKIKEDIINAVLTPVINSEFNTKLKSVTTRYLTCFNKCYHKIITECRDKILNNWNNGPTEEIKELFLNSYTYGKRRTDNKKWNWLKGKNNEEVAFKFIEEGIFTLDQATKTAIKRVDGLSIKGVNDILKAKVNSMTDSEKTYITTQKNVNQWWNSMDDAIKNNCAQVIKNSKNYDESSFVILLTQVYHYNIDWMINGRFKFTKQIKAFIDELQ